MRSLVVLPFVALLGACTSIVFAEPRILVSPYLAIYQLRGEVGVQSAPTAGAPNQDNAPQTMRTLGQDHHREDVGVRVDVGDGFGGVRFDYYKLDMGTARVGELGADWGNLLATDPVQLKAKMDELRISYLEPLGTLRTTWRERPLTLRAAIGGMFQYRNMRLDAKTEAGDRTQKVQIEGDIVGFSGRLRAAWQDFAFDADYSVSPEFELSGDLEGLMQDLELRASWNMALHDVTFFGGYRLSTFAAKGFAGTFAYDADLIIDGFQFGVTVTF